MRSLRNSPLFRITGQGSRMRELLAKLLTVFVRLTSRDFPRIGRAAYPYKEESEIMSANPTLFKAVQEAEAARKSGVKNPKPYGGSHRNVRLNSCQFLLESNHTPPKDVYKSSPYSSIDEQDMPAILMHFYHHRHPRGDVGGASSTGGSGVMKAWDSRLDGFMQAGEFYKAMKQDFIDVMNTSHPNSDYYKEALGKAAEYARNFKFVRSDNNTEEYLIKDDKEYLEVLSVIFG